MSTHIHVHVTHTTHVTSCAFIVFHLMLSQKPIPSAFAMQWLSSGPILCCADQLYPLYVREASRLHCHWEHLHRTTVPPAQVQSSQPSLLRGWLCSVHQGQPYRTTNTCLLHMKADKMWEDLWVTQLTMPSLSANFCDYFTSKRFILRRKKSGVWSSPLRFATDSLSDPR